MPYADPEMRRASARQRREAIDEERKATAPYSNVVVGPNKRLAHMKSTERDADKGGRASAMQAHVPAPINLAPVNVPTLADLDAKYGPL